MDNSNSPVSWRVYRLQHLPLEIPERCWKELTEWLCALIESVMELCQRDLLSLDEIETFLKWAGSDAEILLTSSERSEPQADMLLEACGRSKTRDVSPWDLGGKLRHIMSLRNG
jgi:hypothetical protein